MKQMAAKICSEILSVHHEAPITRQMDFPEETLLQYHGQFLASLLTGCQSSIRRWHGRALSMTGPKGSTVAHLWQRGKKQKEVP
jgi:hypothetical protein